ncbi:MAG: YraN family protein [Oscillospiraceae bacterium]|nr:YraN family protein [Oscillospiraceae bacterium]
MTGIVHSFAIDQKVKRVRTKQQTGSVGERLTEYYLTKSGYRILERNWRIRGGEIDLIAEKDGIIAFVEVKTRTMADPEGGAYAVTPAKQRLCIRAAREYLLRTGNTLQPRFDVAEVIVNGGRAVRFNYYDNAFYGDDGAI